MARRFPPICAYRYLPPYAQGLCTFGFDHAGIDGVDADLARAKFFGQHAGDAVDRPLGARINRRVRRRQGGDSRTDIDDAAARVTEQLDGLTSRQKQAEDVGVKLFVEQFLGHTFQRRELIDAGIVDQNVELAIGFARFREEMLDISGFSDIALDRDGLAALGSDGRDRFVSAFLAGSVIDDDLRAFRRQMLGDGRANALGCTSDDRDFSFEFHNHVNLLALNELAYSSIVRYNRTIEIDKDSRYIIFYEFRASIPGRHYAGGRAPRAGRSNAAGHSADFAEERRQLHVLCAGCPHSKLAKSTLSNHFRILREAGLIRSAKQGVEHRNVLRDEDINARFPGLLKLVLKLAA